MSTVDYKIFFNSSNATEWAASGVLLTKGNNLQHLEITQARESMIQNANLTLFGLASDDEDKLKLNSKIDIYLSTGTVYHHEFSGRVNRIGKNLAGTKLISLQCVGSTYELWRYFISDPITFQNKYTGYIASSLVANYVPTATPGPISDSDGVLLESISFENIKVGDAITRLSRLDDYSFWIEPDGIFHYQRISGASQFTIRDSDILSLSSLETSDDELKNDVIVQGATNRELVTSSYYDTDWYTLSSASVLIAEKFPVPDNLSSKVLSGIELYLTRSSGANAPSYFVVDIREDDNNKPGTILDNSSLAFSAGDLLNPPGYILKMYETSIPTPSSAYWLVAHFDAGDVNRYWKLRYGEYSSTVMDFSSDPNITGTWDYNSTDFGDVSWSSTLEKINIFAWVRGQNYTRAYDKDINRRVCQFNLENGPFNTDEIEFSFRIHPSSINYKVNDVLIQPKLHEGDSEKWHPRLMLGIVDSTDSLGKYPSVGVEFNIYKRNYSDNELFLDMTPTGTYGEKEAPKYKISFMPSEDSGDSLKAGVVKLKRVDLYLKADSAEGSANVTISLYLNDGGSLGDLIAESNTVTVSNTNWTWVSFTFSSEPLLYPGSTYWLYIDGGDTYFYIYNVTDFTNGSDYLYWYRYSPGPDVWYSEDGIAWFKLYAAETTGYCVRPYLAVDITSNWPVNPEWWAPDDWWPTGTTYKISISGSYLRFYVDDVLKYSVSPITSIVLDGGHRFGCGYPHNFDKFQIVLIDAAKGGSSDVYDLAWISGAKFDNLTLPPAASGSKYIATSTDSGSTWTVDYSKVLRHRLYWNYGTVSAHVSSASSIEKYGAHPYKLTDSSIGSVEEATEVANRILSKYAEPEYTGKIVIDGRLGIDISKPFTINSTKLPAGQCYIANYTQSLDKNGFVTIINFGNEPYDVAKRIAKLENEVFGS